MPYLPAIDGLRAVAVILVLLFHAKVPLLSGGYIGVDVFFVISGYLIARLIQQQHDAQRFSLIDFYERRIRRIFPALFLVLFATVAIGAIIMLPPDVARLGTSAVSSALFASNFYFWKQRLNYLQDYPDFEPLLHTWSLAIEEQFYLVFPVFMLLVLRVFRRLDWTFVGVALVSLAVSDYLSTMHPRAAFYFSFSRAWELLLGAWLAVSNARDLVPRRLIPVLQWTGAAMIAFAAVRYDRLTPFPGLAALVPCVGTALLIAWSDVPTRLIGSLSQPVVVWVGLISYPLYLWHWPLLVLARIELLREPAPHEIALIYLVAVGLAAGTWHYLEKPIRARKWQLGTKQVFASAAAVTCLAVAVGGGLRVTRGLWGDPPPAVSAILASAKDFAPSRAACHNWDRQKPEQFADCIMGDRTRPTFDFALVGDSHAAAMAPAVDAVGRGLGQKGLQMTSDNCLPVPGVEVVLNGAVTDCAARNQATLELLRQHGVRRVVLAGAWMQYLGDYDKVLRLSGEADASLDSTQVWHRQLMQTIRRLREAGIDVVIVGPVPFIPWNVPSVLAASEWRGRPPPDGPQLSDFMAQERKVLPILGEAQREGAAVIYPHERLCRSRCIVRLDGHVLYSDGEHLTSAGADLLRPMLAGELSRTREPR